MKRNQSTLRILLGEGIGFLAIIALSWADEYSDLPHVLGGQNYVPNWREGALETLIVLLVAIPVMILTYRISARLIHLEGFLRVCAWCKRLELDGDWISSEEFISRKLDTKTTHGMCQSCFAEAEKQIKNRPAPDRNQSLPPRGRL